MTSDWATIRITRKDNEQLKNLAAEFRLRTKKDTTVAEVVSILLSVYKASRLEAEAK